MATVSASVVGSLVPVTGGGYTAGDRIRLAVSFAATDNKRRYLELYTAVADGSGAISFDVPIKHTGGTMVVKTLVVGQTTVLATSSNQSV